MLPLTQQAHRIVSTVLRPGDIAIDGTAGNGFDTLFLSQHVGPAGRVYAFDVQSEALVRTRSLLDAQGVTNVALIHRSHDELDAAVLPAHCGHIAAAMFNLGYLPGSDKRLTTRASTTLSALSQAIGLLHSGGVLTVICYQGHAGGKLETEQVRMFLSSVDVERFCVAVHTDERRRDESPVLFAVQRRVRGNA